VSTLAAGEGGFDVGCERSDRRLAGVDAPHLEVTAQKTGGDGSITGTFHWMSSYADGSRSNDCLVTYQAMLTP
jgi:hypothetical protein